MLFNAKNSTAKWKGRNVFSYSVSGMSQVVSTKRVLALVRVKPTLRCTYVNTAKRQHSSSCFKKGNNNNFYNLTDRARTVSAIKLSAS